MSETASVLGVAEGSATIEFTDFFRAEYPGLVRALYLLTADQSEAEELAQEAMARAYERWERVGVMTSPGGYVYRTAVNVNRKRFRHLAMGARRGMGLAGDARPSPEIEELVELAAALSSIPVRLREAFMLVEWLGFSAEEAGRMLGIRPSSVRSRILRARGRLRECLLDEGDDDG